MGWWNLLRELFSDDGFRQPRNRRGVGQRTPPGFNGGWGSKKRQRNRGRR